MIILAADHAGFELKEKIKAYLTGLGYECKDMGAVKMDPVDDYPDFIIPAARKVAENPGENRGIIFGGSGQGEAMAANRIKGVRAAVYYGGAEEIIRLSREQNNANVLSIGVRFVTLAQAKKAVKMWLETPFSEDKRHIRRISKF